MFEFILTLLSFVSAQKENNVPEDCGPVQDLRELERLDQIHDAGDNAQRDCHVGLKPHIDTDAYKQTSHSFFVFQGHDDDCL